MTVRNAPALLFLGLAQIALGWYYDHVSWLLWWSGADFVLVGLAYVWNRPQIFGKRPDGTLTGWRGALLFPYLLFAWVVWSLETRLRREVPFHEVAPGLWLWRRVPGRDLPPSVSLFVDLTSEFWEPASVRRGRTYLCLPTLDGATPEPQKLRELVQAVSVWPGEVYVHCALGRGRSALVVAAVLLAKGAASDLEDATQKLRQARAGVRLNPVQEAFLRGWKP